MTFEDLTDDQKQAFENIKEWVNDFSVSSSTYHTLSGKAGSGKTHLMDFVIKHLKNDLRKHVVATATTNKAVKVLKEKIHNFHEFSTIHSLLNIKPIRKGSKEVFKPVNWDESDITQYDVVVIDEASMISEELLEIINTQVHSSMKVLFVGDSAQLQPINEQVSKVFAYDGSNLNQIVRHGDVIANVADKVRNIKLNSIPFEDLVNPPAVDNIDVHGVLELFEEYKVDPNNIRLLCWTNARVHYWNRVLRTADYGFEPEQPFIKGDVVLANDACSMNGRIIMMNKEEGMVTAVEDQSEYFQLEIEKEMGGTAYVNVIKDEFKTKLAKTLQDHADGKRWRQFWDLKKFYHDIRHCYAMTTHSCVTADTWLYSDSGMIQLKDLNNGAKPKEVKDLLPKFKIYNGQELETPINFYNNGVSKNKHIVTDKGYELNASLEHGIDVLGEDGYIKRKNVSELKIGDNLIINRKNDIFGNFSEFPNEWLDRSSLDVRSEWYNRPKKMTPLFGRFLGYMVADGTLRHQGINFNKRHEDVTIDFGNTVETIFGYKSEVKYRRNVDNIIEISSTDIADFCLNIGGILTHDKYVPNCILQSSKDVQCEFLKSIFEDGTVNLKNDKFDHIELSMKNKLLRDQIKLMLLNMGIITSVYNDKSGDLYRLFIYRKYAKIFHKYIGFVSKFKNDRLEKCLIEPSKTYCESIPHLNKIVKGLYDKYNLKRKNNLRVYDPINYYGGITEETLEIFINQHEELMGHEEDFKYLKSFIDNYYIDSIKSIDINEKNTYCIEMPRTHKFIQNGIHAYNSQGSTFKNVVLHKHDIDKNKDVQNRNQLVYVGITRASDKVFFL